MSRSNWNKILSNRYYYGVDKTKPSQSIKHNESKKNNENRIKRKNVRQIIRDKVENDNEEETNESDE